MIEHPYPEGTLCLIVGTLRDDSVNLGKQCEIAEELEEIEWEHLNLIDEGYGVRFPDSSEVLYALKNHVMAIEPDDGEFDEEDVEQPTEEELQE